MARSIVIYTEEEGKPLPLQKGEEEGSGFVTPKGAEYRIAQPLQCPPAPVKRRAALASKDVPALPGVFVSLDLADSANFFLKM
ncbi:hypothetical protein SUGI_1204900 [Cryptomeria japonica]|nr:hypothetical protein SUGI_1204900 [Cryptomeria japonica]